jgi:hypothetical protein
MSIQQIFEDFCKKIKPQNERSRWENFFSSTKWYFVVLVFLEVFIIVLWKGFALNKNLENPLWAGVFALVFVLPPFIPAIIEFISTRVSGFTIPGIVQVSLKDISAKGTDPELATILSQEWGFSKEDREQKIQDKMCANSYCGTIDEKIYQLSDATEFLAIDLDSKDGWIPPNLYYLALLLDNETSVDQIVILATNAKDRQFIGMCSPRKIIEQFDFSKEFNTFRDAAESIPRIGKHYDLQFAANSYFTEVYKKENSGYYSIRLDSQAIHHFFPLHSDYIEFKEKFSIQDYKQILYSSFPYTAVIEDGAFKSLVKRDKVAYAVARAVL